MSKADLQIISFETQRHLEKWLAGNHSKSPGIWMRIFKKASGKKSVNYDQALDVALCYGWIDGLRKRHDEVSFVQRFTPRRARSLWSKRNCGHVARLIKCKKMRAAGLKVIEAAKADGRWDVAYESPKKMVVPEDFLKELAKDRRGKKFFEGLSKVNHYSIAWRLATAIKPEIREKRMKKILEMMAAGQSFH
jgi:uncharacterized protein YdeI (YjbR/CyaY-like superfamily)